jgi:hypothetical protein
LKMCWCCGKGDCCYSKNTVMFKLSLLGVFFSLIMIVIGLFYPFNRITTPIPVAWLLALFIILPSVTVYYEVKEKFWAEVIECQMKEKKAA